MDGQSFDNIKDKQLKLKELLPEAFTEDKIDWEKLKLALGEDINFENERYHLNWAGKSDAFRALQQRTSATLKPVREESVNFDTTENVFIEGENLEVLKILQKSYFGKIKMIYIDPPYNTGNDSFIYPDKFSETKDEYLKRIGDKDEEGYLLKEGMFRKNSKDSGHYHSNWLTMMYPRLYIARNLLKEDGVIFVSIDDNEVHNLKMIMNEIFGEENYLAQFVWRTDGNFDNQAKVKKCHEYILAYGKEIEKFPHPPIIDPNIPLNSKLYTTEIRNTIVKNGPANPVSDIVLPIGFKADFETGIIKTRTDKWPHYKNDAIIKDHCLQNEVIVYSGWSSKDLVLEFINNGLNNIVDGKGQETSFCISKTGAIEVVKSRKTNQSHVISVLNNMGNTQSTSSRLVQNGIYFDYPKPEKLLNYLISMNDGDSFVVLDFFAGAGSIAQAVMELNREDNGSRKFILVQLPEKTDENSEAFKAGYKTIADISKERIRRVINKLAEEETEKDSGQEKLFENKEPKENKITDAGFKVFRHTASNFKHWRTDIIENGDDLNKMVDLFDTQVKESSLNEDMLYELILKSGYKLTDKVEEKNGYYLIDGGSLIIVLKAITQEIIDNIINLNPKPETCIMLDKLFNGDDQLKTNTALQMEDAGIKMETI